MTAPATRRFSSLTPQYILIVLQQIFLVSIIALIVYQPNIGMSLISNSELESWQLRTTLHPELDGSRNRIVALFAQDTNESPPYELTLPWEHHSENSLWILNAQARNTFFDANEDLFALQRQNKFGIAFEDGSVFWVDTRSTPAWFSLSFRHWFSLGFAFAFWSAMIWLTRFEFGHRATHLLLAGTFCLTGWMTIATAMSARLLAYPPNVAIGLHGAQTLFFAGTLLFSCLFLLHYPMSPSKPVRQWLSAGLITFFALGLSATHAVSLIGAAAVMYGGLLAYQWWCSRANALAQASVRWILLCWLVIAVAVSASFLPMLFSLEPWFNTGFILPVFVLLASGHFVSLLNVHAAQIEIWFRMSWFWALGGLSVVLIDVIFIYGLHINTNMAFVLAMLIVSWGWFPIRQWLQGRFLSGSSNVEQSLALIPNQLLNLSEGPAQVTTRTDQWRQVFITLFHPHSIQQLETHSERAWVAQQGLRLYVPLLDQNGSLLLEGKSQGRALFQSSDLKLAQKLANLASDVLQQKATQRATRSQERQRIMRDLHDDVCPLLLTLIHRQPEPQLQQTARSALQRLRESIYSLDDQAVRKLPDFLQELKQTMSQRLIEKNIALSWQYESPLPELNIPARLQINLSRAIHECVTNCLKYSETPQVIVTITADPIQGFTFRFVESNTAPEIESWLPGKGIHSINKRIEELSGTVTWTLKQDGLTIDIHAPLSV